MELELTVNGVSGTVRLWPAGAPRTVAALVASLPFESRLEQCRWSGDACFTVFAEGSVCELGGVEAPAVTIYPGTLVVRPAEPAAPHAELLIGYGAAEHRWPDGPKPVTPVGEITTGRDQLFGQLRAVAAAGPASLVLRVAEGQA